MNRDQVNQSSSKKWLNPMPDIEVEFKPLTDGLGFQHGKAHRLPTQPTRKVISPKAQATHSTLESFSAQHHNDLMAFYQKAKASEKSQMKQMQEEKSEQVFSSALPSQRVLAWGLDQMFLLSLVSLIFFFAERFTAVGILSALAGMSFDVILVATTLWAVFQIFYFTFTDRLFNQTLGQAIVGIEVRHQQNPDIMRNFLRGLIKVFSLLSFGILAWYDIQSKATDSQVIRK